MWSWYLMIIRLWFISVLNWLDSNSALRAFSLARVFQPNEFNCLNEFLTRLILKCCGKNLCFHIWVFEFEFSFCGVFRSHEQVLYKHFFFEKRKKERETSCILWATHFDIAMLHYKECQEWKKVHIPSFGNIIIFSHTQLVAMPSRITQPDLY